MIGLVTMEYYDHRRNGSVGSSRIRGEWIAKYWDQCEMYSTGKEYEGLIFQKAYWEEMVKNFNGKKFFDICDPDWLDNRPVVEMIRNCNGVVTSTQALADQIKKFDIGNIPVICIPDRVDLEWSRPVREKHKGCAKSCVYFGYSGNAKVVLEPAIESLKRRGLSLTVISDQPFYANDEFVRYDQETVNEEIIKHDIVLLPNAPSNNYRFQFKSNNKTIQSWALGMPVATNGTELDRFLNGKEREKERVKRLKEVKEKWDVKISVKEWQDFYVKTT